MLSNFTLEKTIPIPKCFCFTIHQLTNGIILAGLMDSKTLEGFINIYDESNNLKKQLTCHKKGVICINQLKTGEIITCSDDSTIKILDLNDYEIIQNLECLSDSKGISKVIELNNSNLVSSDWNHILFWNKNPASNKYELIKDLNLKKFTSSIMEFGENKLLAIHGNNKEISIFDLEKYEKLKEFNNILLTRNFYHIEKISNDVIFVGGLGIIYLISASKLDIIKKITCENGVGLVSSVLKLKDNTILASISSHANGNNVHLIKFKIIDDGNDIEVVERKDNIHKGYVFTMFECQDGKIWMSNAINGLEIYKSG